MAETTLDPTGNVNSNWVTNSYTGFDDGIREPTTPSDMMSDYVGANENDDNEDQVYALDGEVGGTVTNVTVWLWGFAANGDDAPDVSVRVDGANWETAQSSDPWTNDLTGASGEWYSYSFNGSWTLSDLQVRLTTPTMGSKEQYRIAALYAVVTDDGGGTPTLSNPSATETGPTTADLSADTDETGGTMYAVVTESASPPTGIQINNGLDANGDPAAWEGSSSVAETGTVPVSATGLSPETTYYAHLVHKGANSEYSNVVTSAAFTTDATGVLPPDWLPVVSQPLPGSVVMVPY